MPSSGSNSSKRARGNSRRRPKLVGPSPKTATSDRILVSAAHLFAKLGFANTSMPAIAKQSGISPGAIYWHFNSKAQLLMEVVRYALHTLPTSVQVLEPEPAELDASDLPEFAASYTTPDYKLMRQLSLEIHAAASRGRDAKSLLTKVDGEAARRISESLLAAQNSGVFEKKLDPYFAAIFFQVMMMGLAHLDTLQPDLIGNQSWHDFIFDRVSAALSLRRPTQAKSDSNPSLSSKNAELESE